jgi:hypothetical protein
MKYVEKGIIIKDVDPCSMWTNAHGAMFTHKRMSTRGERSVPLPMRFAVYCILVDSFGELKGSKMWEMRDAQE